MRPESCQAVVFELGKCLLGTFDLSKICRLSRDRISRWPKIFIRCPMEKKAYSYKNEKR